MVSDAGLNDCIKVDSAGTADWHPGRAPDPRTCSHALKRNYDLSDLRARQAVIEDFARFDYILAMDSENLANLQSIAPSDYAGYLGLMLDLGESSDTEVPDPYYEAEQCFERVLDLLEDASQALLTRIKTQLLEG
tara:strand:- start:592 stop:996 length:405 start_codon:yes stop_codon:yes gene_type:complete